MKKLLLFLLLSFDLSAQNISFSVGEILIMDSNRNRESHIFLKEGMLKVNLKSKKLIYQTDNKKKKLRIHAYKKSDYNSLIIQTENGYSFVVFEDFFVMRKLFTFEDKFIYIEQKLYTIIKFI
jgi:hypothetical protein